MADGTGLKFETVDRDISIKPGMGAHTLIRFSREGNERKGAITSDVQITIRELPHPVFQRQGNNLVYLHKINLADAIKSTPIHFTTLEGDKIETACSEVISPSSEKIVHGRGMPVENEDPLSQILDRQPRGNLIIRFDIQFPLNLSEEKRQGIISILKEQQHEKETEVQAEEEEEVIDDY